MGMPHWAAYLTNGDGSWDKITKNAKHSQQKINEIVDFGPPGYARLTHHDRQMRLFPASGRKIRRNKWRRKVGTLIAARKKKGRIKRRVNRLHRS
jgi:hypothetical protein